MVMGLSAEAVLASEKGIGPGGDCDLHSSPCTRPLSDFFVVLDIDPKPVKAMRELAFKVTLSGRGPGADPFIDLEMPGMDMGPNRVVLRPVGQGEYLGRGILVRCPSGRRLWRAKVSVPGSGEVEFLFHVLY